MKFVRNITYSTIQTIFTLVLGFICNILIARTLGPKNMGDYTFFIWLVSLFSYIILLGLPMTITKYVSQYFFSEKEKIKLIFKLLKFPLFIFIIAILTITLYEIKIGLKLPVNIIILFLGLTILILDNITNSIVSGIQNFKILMFGKMISLSFYIFMLFLFLKRYPFPYVVIYLYMSQLIIHIFFIFYNTKNEIFGIISYQKNILYEKEIYNNILNYYKYVSIALILDYVVWQNSEIFFIKIYNTPQDIAFYSIGFTISYLPHKILGSAFGSVTMPLMSSLYGSNNNEKLNYSYTFLTQYLSFLLIPVYIFMFLYAENIIKIIYTEKYLISAYVMKIIISAGLIGGIASIGSSYVHAIEKPQIIVKIGFFVAILNILLNIWLIPKYSCIGAAVGNSIAQITACVSGIIYIVLKYKLAFPLFKLLKYFIIACFCGFFIKKFVFTTNITFIKIILAFIIYSAFFLLINFLFNEERKTIIQTLKNIF